MCHRRGEWSRTSSRAPETKDEREREEAAGWTARARERLAALVPTDRGGEPPARPAVDSQPTSMGDRDSASMAESPESADPTDSTEPADSTESTDSTEPTDVEEEREEEPIPADD